MVQFDLTGMDNGKYKVYVVHTGLEENKRELGDALKSKIVEGRKKVFWME